MASSGGTSLSVMGQFVIDTGKHTLDPGHQLLEAAKQNYLFLEDLAKGKDGAMTVKSGKVLSHVSQLTEATQFGFYQPNDTFTYGIENLDVEMTYNWRFAHDCWVYTDHEEMLNAQGPQFEQIYDVVWGKRAACQLSMLNGMDTALWTTPSNATMEASTGTRPYSIRSWITSDGLAPAGFTTLGGVNPTTYTRWRNQTESYATANIDAELLPAFDRMVRKVNFQVPDTMKQYLTETRFNKYKILTNIDGDTKYGQLIRAANCQLQGGPGGQRDLGYVNDGANVFRGIVVRYVKEMGNVGFASTQPPFYWVNSDHLFPVFHNKMYMRQLDPMHSTSQPYTWVVHVDTAYQIVCTSRQRQGYVGAV